MTRYLLLIICIFISLTTGYTQKKPVNDSSVVNVRLFDGGEINKYKADPDFQYDRLLEPPVSLWDRFWNWFWRKVEELLSTEAGKNTFKTLLTVLAVAVLVYTIMKLTGMTSAGLFGNRNTSEKLPYSTHEEDIHAISFEEAIEQAVKDGNYRLAVRLLYLQSLKKLTDKGLINWQINKTNIAYVQELSGTFYQQSFNELTLKFETNWYGDRHIAPDEFRLVQDQFNQFNKQIR
jgi:hypothetical protein